MGNKKIQKLQTIGGSVKKVLLVAPVLSRSGYGEMARFALRAMAGHPQIDLYLHNIAWGKSGWVWNDDGERKLIDSLLQKTVMYRQNGGTFDASIQTTVPNEWQKLTKHDVGYTAGIETDKVAPEWLLNGNEKVDKIITISEHSKQVYLNTSYDGKNQQTGEPVIGYKLNTPIDVVGFPITKTKECEELDLELKHDFNFLCVAQIGPRKNVDAVINNFIEEFKNEEVGIVFKVHMANDSVMDFHNVKHQFSKISQVAKEEDWACSIKVVHGNLTNAQMNGLYSNPKIKAFVSLTHGEGFGLPLYEAASHKIPVVATDWSGHLDFLTLSSNINPKGKYRGGKTRGKISTPKKMFAAVKYELNTIPQHAVWNGVLQADSKWAFINDSDARKKMRDVYKNHKKWQGKANKLAKALHEKDEQHYYDLFIKSTGINFGDTVESSEESVIL